MRLLTWNLNARRRQLPDQLAAVAVRSPDILALQEVTPGSIPLLRESLPTFGLFHITDSFAHAPRWDACGPRRYGVLLASRFPVEPHRSDELVLWPERILSATMTADRMRMVVHTTHIPPGSSNGEKKIEMLEAVLRVISEVPAPQILCGDFNVPQLETAEGQLVSWAERVETSGAVRLRRRYCRADGRRWDAAERGVMQRGTIPLLVDAYRHLHGYERQEFSWFVKRGALRIGRRFDHIFCSPELRIVRCEYLHHVREQGLSDHSALEADFEF